MICGRISIERIAFENGHDEAVMTLGSIIGIDSSVVGWKGGAVESRFGDFMIENGGVEESGRDMI